MASRSDLRPKAACGCEAFQSPRPRRFSHDVAQVSIPIQHARASAWTALRSSRSIVVLLMLFRPEHDVSSWHKTDVALRLVMSVHRCQAEIICSLRVFRVLTLRGQSACGD